jgi:hypothetical protein
MRKLKTLASMRIAGSLLAILVLPAVARADDEQQYESTPINRPQEMPRVVGRSVLLDVPGLGEVSVSEEGYRKISDLLTSDDAADQEEAFALLQRIQDEESTGSADAESAPQSAGPINMAPPGLFRIVHPPITTSSVAPDDNVRDLAEPLSFDHPLSKRRARGLW